MKNLYLFVALSTFASGYALASDKDRNPAQEPQQKSLTVEDFMKPTTYSLQHGFGRLDDISEYAAKVIAERRYREARPQTAPAKRASVAQPKNSIEVVVQKVPAKQESKDQKQGQ